MLQESHSSSSPSSGSRFRPYASVKHHVTKGRYITSNDPRGYIPVYEYPLNGQWIMMDIDDGYILWTGIWKALGNSKADIAKMIESQPNLAPLIRRVRGGYLKIQGTWMPYEVALRLSRRVAWAIRDELIPLFGPNFPSTCLSPDQPGFGQVIPSGQVRRRSRKSAQNSIMQVSPSPNNWTVVTTNSAPIAEKPQWSFRPSDYPYNSNQPLATEVGHGSFGPSRISHHQHHHHHHHHPPSAYRRPIPSTKVCLSVDTRSLYPEMSSSSSSYNEPVRLPPIQSTGDLSPKSPYALPPISAMEDLRGCVPQDSAAVLRRLRMEDDYPNSSGTSEQTSWDRRPYAPSSPSSDSSTRFWPYPRSRSQPRHSPYLPRRSPSMSTRHTSSTPRYLVPEKQESIGPIRSDDDSASNPSPTPPITPTSSENEPRQYYNPLNEIILYRKKKHFDGFAGNGDAQVVWPPSPPTATSQSGLLDHHHYSDCEDRLIHRKCCPDDTDSIHSHRPW